MPDTAVLVTLVAGELQLYFASIIQQPKNDAKITLITGHDLNQEPKPEKVALRQNRIVYLVGKLDGVQQYDVELIISLLKDDAIKHDFLECVILNDIALENEHAKDENAKDENIEDENAKNENIEDENAKNENIEDENDLSLYDLKLDTPVKLTGRSSFSSEERPPQDISSWHVFFPHDVIKGMKGEAIKEAIDKIRGHEGYRALMHLVNQSKLSASFLIRKVLHLRKKAINLVTICDCKITLMRIADGVHLEKLNYLNLSDITPVKGF